MTEEQEEEEDREGGNNEDEVAGGSQLEQPETTEGEEKEQNKEDKDILLTQTDPITEFSKEENSSTCSPTVMMVEDETPGTPVQKNRSDIQAQGVGRTVQNRINLYARQQRQVHKQVASVGAIVEILNMNHTSWYSVIQNYCLVMVKVTMVNMNSHQANPNIYLHSEAIKLTMTYVMDLTTNQYQLEPMELTPMAESIVVVPNGYLHLANCKMPYTGELMQTTPVWTIQQQASMAAIFNAILIGSLKAVINRMFILGKDTDKGVMKVVKLATREYQQSIEPNGP